MKNIDIIYCAEKEWRKKVNTKGLVQKMLDYFITLTIQKMENLKANEYLINKEITNEKVEIEKWSSATRINPHTLIHVLLVFH